LVVLDSDAWQARWQWLWGMFISLSKRNLLKRPPNLRLAMALKKEFRWALWPRKSTWKNVLGFIEKGVQEGARLLLDGRDVKVKGYPDGASCRAHHFR